MPSSPKGNVFGARGGNWLPELIDGQLPFGAVGGTGVRQTCPIPVLAVCGCQYAFWIVPGDVGKACPFCREPHRAVA